MPFGKTLQDRGIRVLQHYGVDWLLAVLIATFTELYLDRFQNIPDFDLTDTTIQHSFVAKEVFPNSTLAYILAFAYVLLVMSNLALSRNMWDLHHALLGLTVAFALSGTFVQIVRITVGRPRPDFLARCNPFENATNGHFFGLANTTRACHSSATGLGFNSLYWAGKFQLFNQKSYTSKAWLVFSPLIASIYICITRVTDHRHHWEDVTLGFFTGLIFAFSIYRQFYPALEDPHSHLPYAPRLAREPSGLPRHSMPRQWFSIADEQPTPLLPTSRANREMRASTSNLGHASVEADLESSGLIASPFNPLDNEAETGYSGMPKADHHPTGDR
ncbi:hypothetical protein B0H10DRAFT_2216624 [Mycena sp. CBHHK59/15]|nr:hypothetical protein B0H10DRAFT_2216624 [Mycena sp. CBHHK59/15]